MLICEGFKMFRGQATIRPANKEITPFSLYGTWLYRPDTDCWYINGMSFADEIVTCLIED